MRKDKKLKILAIAFTGIFTVIRKQRDCYTGLEKSSPFLRKTAYGNPHTNVLKLVFDSGLDPCYYTDS
jgi:hypothetical protein